MTLNEMILSSISAALIVIFAASYAIFYAFSQLRKKQALLYLSYACFSCLIIATITLVNFLDLTGRWEILMMIMLFGYWITPKIIWHLSVGVNKEYSKRRK